MTGKFIWTEEKEQKLIKMWNTILITQLAKDLNCKVIDIKIKAEELGLDDYEPVNKSHVKWTKEEDELLYEYSKKYLLKTIAKKLNRTEYAVIDRARRLNIKIMRKRNPWKKWMIDYLKDNINKQSYSQISKMIGMSYWEIIIKCKELGIEKDDNRWTEEEIKLLKDLASKYYKGKVVEVVSKKLNRTPAAVKTKLQDLNIECITAKRIFSNDEISYIKENYGKIPITKMAEELEVSRIIIQGQIDNMGLERLGNNPYNRKWSEEAIKELRKLSEVKTITELAKYFNTTNDAISTIAHSNDIKLIDEKIKWSNLDNEILRKYAKTMTIEEIAKKMNKSVASVRIQAKRQNIEIKKDEEIVNRNWTKENDEALLSLVNEGKDLFEIMEIMNKKDSAIIKHTKKLNLNLIINEKKWTDEDDKKLKELSETKYLDEMVLLMHKTSDTIRRHAKKLNINLKVKKKTWTKEELELLEKLVMIDKKTPEEVAQILGRTQDAVIIKINRSGFQIQTNNKRFWKDDEIRMLEDMYGEYPIDKIAEKLNRTVSSVSNKLRQLGLGSAIDNNYDGLTIAQLSDVLSISEGTIRYYYIPLGLKYKKRKISKTKEYVYIEINDLLEFLKQNQNIWSSKNLEENILGKEPEWLKEKRIRDLEVDGVDRTNIVIQQLIREGKYFVDEDDKSYIDDSEFDEKGPSFKKRGKIN